MDLGLKGRSALVCGSTQGLGLAIALTLAAEGAQVVICGRNPHRLDAARTLIENAGGRVCAVAADLKCSAGREAIVSAGLKAYKRIDIAVLNMGGPPTGGLESLELSDWQGAYAGLVESAVHLSKLLVPAMANQGWGRLVAVTSYVARQPADQLLLSNSLRAAVSGLIRSIANEYGARGVTANSVLPGYIRTERMQTVARKQAAAQGQELEMRFDELSREIPVGRIGEPQELADVVAFLASERSSYLNGGSITVDGGLVRTVY